MSTSCRSMGRMVPCPCRLGRNRVRGAACGNCGVAAPLRCLNSAPWAPRLSPYAPLARPPRACPLSQPHLFGCVGEQGPFAEWMDSPRWRPASETWPSEVASDQMWPESARSLAAAASSPMQGRSGCLHERTVWLSYPINC